MVRSFISIAQSGVSPGIGVEASFFLHAILTGGLLLVLYDFLRIFRRVYKHTAFSVNLEDFFYWIASSIIIFVVLVKENNGIIRWFFVLGMFLGMMIYHLTLSRYFVRSLSFLIKKTLHLVSIVLGVLFKPIQFVVNFLAKHTRKYRKTAQEIIKKNKKNVETYIKKRYNDIKWPHRQGKKSDRSISGEQYTRKKKTKRE